MKIAFLVAAAATALSAGSVLATPISFEFTGTGSGTLNGSAFGPSAFTASLQGDASNRTSRAVDVWWTPADSASITIAGLGTYNFTTSLHVYSNTSMGVGFSRQRDGSDLYELMAPPGWDMLSDISATDTGYLLQRGNSPVITSGGTLYFNNNTISGGTFTASVLPEPSGLALVILAGAALGRRRHA